MLELNLAYPEKSHIDFQLSSYPDGQHNVLIKEFKKVNMDNNIIIKSRFNSFEDLEKIACAAKALRRKGFDSLYLFIPYLLGARSDKIGKTGEPNYLVDVVAPFLNLLNFKEIQCMDVHSNVAAACIPNLVSYDNSELVHWALEDLATGKGTEYKEYLKNGFVFISPDAGSLTKIYHMADQLFYTNGFVICSKYRDWEGKLSRVDVPVQGKELAYGSKDFIIVDDICDGGRTFVNISKELIRAMGGMKAGKTYLIVTHGIFSAGFEELYKHFDGIYCTNSYSDISNRDQNKLKQTDIF